MTKYLFLILVLILAIPAAVNAQGPRSGFFPWWDSPMVSGLDLNDAQRTEIRSVIREYRGRMVEVRDAVQKAEGDLDAVFNEDTVDQQHGSEAIDRLTKARADMTKSVSEMSLRMRAVLTSQQWQELQRRQQAARVENAGRGSGSQKGAGRGRRLAKGGAKDSAPRTADSQPQPPPPALNQ
jgi:Spy/CpxP family protein refolding chaperone